MSIWQPAGVPLVGCHLADRGMSGRTCQRDLVGPPPVNEQMIWAPPAPGSVSKRRVESWQASSDVPWTNPGSRTSPSVAGTLIAVYDA